MASTVVIAFGISRYSDNRFPALPAAQIDAVYFARALQCWGVEEVTLFLNEQATIDNLRKWFASVARADSDRKLVFYFCGHGQREAGAIPSSHLLFYDDRLNLDSLITSICQLEIQESYIFIDACSLRINNLLNPRLHEELKGNLNSHKSLFCLLSSGIQESFENNRYGYFTDALLKCLSRLRKTEVDPTHLFREICAILRNDELPLPEMYNFECQKLSFLPTSPLFLERDGLLPRSELMAAIADACINHRGKVGVLAGERGSGKTSLCRFLSSSICNTFYVKIPPFLSSASLPALLTILKPQQTLEDGFSHGLIFFDDTENLTPEQICQFLREVANTQLQCILVARENLIIKLPSSLQKNMFLLEMSAFSPEEGKQLLRSYHLGIDEESLVYVASKGNPLKMEYIARHLLQDSAEENLAEKEQFYPVIAAIYACGCYLDREVFAEVFHLSSTFVELLEKFGLVRWEENAWVPHPCFYEIAEKESDFLTIERDKVLEYWYREIKQSPHRIRAAQNLIWATKCLGYEKKGDPYLKIAFKTLYHDGKDHREVFIDGAHIFQFHREMTEASAVLAEILTELQCSNWADKLRQAKPLKRKRRILVWSGCLLAALMMTPLIYQSMGTISLQTVNLKQIHPDFVGRNQYIQQLQTMCLKWDHAPSIAVLWGEAGIGKSEIAIAFANLYAKHFTLIGWIDCGTEESYAASYYALAQFLQIPIDQEKDLVKKVHHYLETQPLKRPWLLILDNMEQKRELPSKGKGSIIATTRDRSSWHSQSCIHVLPFQEKEAMALLKKITNNADSPQIFSLIHELDFFPLTLNLAAHYIAETPEMNEEIYLKLLTQSNIDLIASMPADDRYASSLLSSWNIKADELAEHDPEILQWLHFCSCLCPSGIPAFWIEKWFADIQHVKDPFHIKIRSAEILRNLANQCLIRYEKPTHTLCLHHLRQDVMKKDRHFRTETIDQVAQFLINYTENLEKIYEKEKHLSQWGDLREWEPHAAWFIANYGSSCSQETLSRLQNLLGNWKYIKGDYRAAQTFHEQVLKSRIDLHGEDHPKTITSMNNLATVLWENGRFAESKGLFLKALKASEKLYSEDHLDVIVTLNNLGWVSWEMGQFEEAKALLHRSMYVSKKLRACDPDFLQTANDFIQFFDEETVQDTTSDFEKAAKRALFLRHAGLWIAEVEGNPKKSLGYFKESLEVLKRNLPGEDPRIAIAYGSLGISYNRAGQSRAGKRHLTRALEIQKKILGDEHPETAKSYANLAISYNNLGKFRKALKYHLKALEIRRKSLGEDNPITAKSYSGTGMALLNLGKNRESLFYHQKALDIRKKVLGENHSETAQSYSRIGMSFGKLGEHEKALEFNLKALSILEGIFGDNHYLTANVHTALETCYNNLGHRQRAEYHKQKADEIRSKF